MTGAETRRTLADLLAWQVELGADEAIAETPQDRFAETERLKTAPRKTEAPERPQPAPRPAGPSAPPATMDARALAAGASSLDDLGARLADWDGSELKKGARRCVFADGLPGAHVMVIGEAPGAEEDRAGLPFVGRAGRLLDRMLAAIGLDRRAEDPAKAAYITNILPWRPPGNRTPSTQEAMAFLPFVERHIALAGPRVILSLGNTPTKSLLGTETGIKRMRGHWSRHEASALWLLPSFHPAYLLRQPAEKRLAWHDLLALRAALEGRGQPLGD